MQVGYFKKKEEEEKLNTLLRNYGIALVMRSLL